jgi:hypothetical protein
MEKSSRKGVADLPSPVSELEQTEDFRRLVAVLVGDDSDARGIAAGIDVDPDRPNIANRRAAGEKQASPRCCARHQRFLAFVRLSKMKTVNLVLQN